MQRFVLTATLNGHTNAHIIKADDTHGTVMHEMEAK